MASTWGRRRWLDFRNGHAFYLIFALSFGNFILIFHRLLVERVEFLDNIFDQLWLFTLFFLAVYVPVAVLIGAWHRKTQMSVEQDVYMRQNPTMAKIFGLLIDIQLGKADREKIKEVRDLIASIESVDEVKE